MFSRSPEAGGALMSIQCAFPGDSDTALAMSEGGERIRSLTAPTFVSISAAAHLGCNVVLSR